ncbi:hypothetical protein M758_UG198500 [Ceratodon purpureus]|nr:hypothetical protein M758_UG198500 [Ceratodon purpureus]
MPPTSTRRRLPTSLNPSPNCECAMVDGQEGEVLDNEQGEVIRKLNFCFYFAAFIKCPNDLHVLGILKKFIARCRWLETLNSSLITSVISRKEWPLQLKRVDSLHSTLLAFRVGGGWGQFLRDHNVKIGDLVTLEQVDSRSLVATITRRASPTKPAKEKKISGKHAKQVRFDDTQVDTAGPSRPHSPIHTQEKKVNVKPALKVRFNAGQVDSAGPSRPQSTSKFVKTLRALHIRPDKKAQIRIFLHCIGG